MTSLSMISVSRLVDTQQLFDILPLGLAAPDHVVAVISDCVDCQTPRSHLLGNLPVRNIMNVIVDFIELITAKI